MAEFFIDQPEDEPADDTDIAGENDRADELDLAKIQQRSTLRRAIYRSRSHAIIIAVSCVVGATELATAILRLGRSGSINWLVLYASLLIACVLGAAYAYHRALSLHHEAKRSELSTTGTPARTEPDFSTLGDGSEQWQRLHDVH